jgi:holo-[acyl-carrier protein] synthase
LDRVAAPLPARPRIVGIGIDVAGFARVARFLSDHTPRLGRVFTAPELALCQSGAVRRRCGRYAAAFSAKEAVMKALGTGWRSDVSWTDIDTARRESHGGVMLTGGAREVAERHGVSRVLISVSITADAAVATAVAEGHG